MTQRHYLKDYQASSWAAPAIRLRLDLREDHLIVEAWTRFERRAAGPLRLDGRDMDLLELRIDGQTRPLDSIQIEPEQLQLDGLPDEFELYTRVRLNPYTNTSLEGLYHLRGMLCSQCESHGFSRITYALDRPDVLSVYEVELEADAAQYPVLLSNGELVSRQDLGNGRHSALWRDPHPKPSYLFAAVAGNLACRTRQFTTSEGRDVDIAFYCDHGIEDRMDHAMDSLLRAMRWDEQRYGLAYDLDTYSVVVAAAFNMGAMENKGLNIFNPKYVLASPDTATDQDFADVEAVIAHEYFHNWTGNRVTCRDWFQLSLKEGLTVFRDQQFSADSGAGPAQRIAQVRLLRSRQFAEDAGPLAHPVRPESYVEMNNFYTVTVYEKGAELVRLLHARLGEAGFRRGMDLYVQRHDGQAVTIEDFLAAHGDANGLDTSDMLRWYQQAGTPLVEIEDSFDNGIYQLHARQSVPGHAQARSVPIPLRLSLLDEQGASLLDSQVLELNDSTGSWQFELPSRPAPVLFEGLSAPVKWTYAYDGAQLNTILRHAQDPFSRWEAAQRLFLAALEGVLTESDGGVGASPDLGVFGELLTGQGDPAVIASLLSPPRADELSDWRDPFDPLAVAAAVKALEAALAAHLAPQMGAAYARLLTDTPYRFEPEQAARRRLRARLLELWVRSGDAEAAHAAQQLYAQADNLTDLLAALRALVACEHDAGIGLLDDFYQRYAHDRLVLDRWYALQAQVEADATVERVRALLQHDTFERDNPNRVRALIGSFSQMNTTAFYRADGAGIALLAEQCQWYDRHNPQLAARLVAPLAVHARLSDHPRAQVRQALLQLRDSARSADLTEQVNRILG